MLKFKGISSKNQQNLLDKFSINTDKKWLGINASIKYGFGKSTALFHRLYQFPSAVNVDGVKDFIDKLPVLALALDLQLPYRLADLGVFDDFEFFHAAYVFKLFL